MREIKFRVWTGLEMEYNITAGKFGVFYVNPGNKNNGLDPNDSASLSPFNTKYHDGTPIMQYTGLKDKNGKEIWDGDIIEHENGYIKLVSWVNHGWAFCLRPDKDGRMFSQEYLKFNGGQDATFPDQFIVIGNIYENPELS